MALNIEIEEEFLNHMSTRDLGHFAVSRLADDKNAYVFATNFGNLVFRPHNDRYGISEFTGLDSHKLPICRAFCDVCNSFGDFNGSYAVIGTGL